MEIVQESDVDEIISRGSRILLTLNEKKANVFEKKGSVSLMQGVQSDVIPPMETFTEEV